MHSNTHLTKAIIVATMHPGFSASVLHCKPTPLFYGDSSSLCLRHIACHRYSSKVGWRMAGGESPWILSVVFNPHPFIISPILVISSFAAKNGHCRWLCYCILVYSFHLRVSSLFLLLACVINYVLNEPLLLYYVTSCFDN